MDGQPDVELIHVRHDALSRARRARGRVPFLEQVRRGLAKACPFCGRGVQAQRSVPRGRAGCSRPSRNWCWGPCLCGRAQHTKACDELLASWGLVPGADMGLGWSHEVLLPEPGDDFGSTEDYVRYLELRYQVLTPSLGSRSAAVAWLAGQDSICVKGARGEERRARSWGHEIERWVGDVLGAWQEACTIWLERAGFGAELEVLDGQLDLFAFPHGNDTQPATE